MASSFHRSIYRKTANRPFREDLGHAAARSEQTYLAQGVHEPVITTTTIDRVHDVLSGRKRNPFNKPKIISKDQLLLRGFFICPECNRKLSGSASKRKKYYYHVTRKKIGTNPFTLDLSRGVHLLINPLTILNESIFQVKSGQQYIAKAVRDSLINSVFVEDEPDIRLSPRENQVLQKVCSGQTIKEIAFELKLSAHTVQYYHRSVMEKLNVRRTTDLVVHAMQPGLYVS